MGDLRRIYFEDRAAKTAHSDGLINTPTAETAHSVELPNSYTALTAHSAGLALMNNEGETSHSVGPNTQPTVDDRLKAWQSLFNFPWWFDPPSLYHASTRFTYESSCWETVQK